jgi:FMN-dependent NADH-azoreductase
MKLLHIDSSILGEHSASGTVGREIVARWKDAVPGIEGVTDLAFVRAAVPAAFAA